MNGSSIHGIVEADNRDWKGAEGIERTKSEPMTIWAILLIFWTARASGPAARNSLKPINSGTTSATLAENEPYFGQQQTATRPPRYAGKRAKKEAVVQTLTGTVECEYKPLSWDCDVPNCDHFALYDDATHMNFELDDARAALPFEGRRAKVTGVVDTKKTIIHVISIEEVK